MQRQPFLNSLASLLQPTSPEYAQALARVVIVAGSLWFAFSGFYAMHAPDETAVQMGRLVAVVAAGVSVLIFASMLLRPEDSVLRRLIGIAHDCCAVSAALFLGGDTTAPFAVIYLVIILANGFRYGAPYLACAALCSLIGFALIHMFSPYWVSNFGLSINVMLVLTVVPAYIYRLLNTLQRARSELELRATHDSLTGLMNRAGFEQQLEAYVTPRIEGQVLVYFDLDRFKAVNDGAGHAAGDKLLVAVARIVRDCVRTDDICGRLGGDEFCILLQECPLLLGSQIATRLRMRIHDYSLSWGGRKYSVGASVGVVSSQSIEDGPTFLRLADAACYAAKNAGRNNIHVIDANRTRVNTGEIRALHLE